MILLRLKIGILLTTIAFSSFLFGGCQNPEKQTESRTEAAQTTKDVRKTAWDSLSDTERAEVVGNWKEATMSKVTADLTRFGLDDSSFEGKELTLVTFHSTRSELLGDISKLVDEKSQKVVGGAFRE